MNVQKLSDEGAVQTINEICDGLKKWIESNPECAKAYLAELIDGFLDPMAQDDGFGTEGWEHAFGISD